MAIKKSERYRLDFNGNQAQGDDIHLPPHIDSSEPEDRQDIEAHLQGGIPNRDLALLYRYWAVFPSLTEDLFAPADRPGYSILKIDISHLRTTILAHPDFRAFVDRLNGLFTRWKDNSVPLLERIDKGTHPADLIEAIAEDLLNQYADVPLIDRYDLYRHLMIYWTATMQGDVSMLAADGWQANPDLFPPALIIRRFFEVEQHTIGVLEAERNALVWHMETFAEVYGDEEGLLFDVKNGKGKLTKAAIRARLAAIRADDDAADEAASLKLYLAMIDYKRKANKVIADARKALDAQVTAAYSTLSEADMKTLVIQDKWLDALTADMQAELDRVSQTLIERISQLAERYAVPLPKLEQRVAALGERVREHLKKMGDDVQASSKQAD